MLFDPDTANYLKPWLVRTLEPICDAEPGALADYILALLKHNAPEVELRKELVVQLEEFLEKEGPSFVETLFTALRTKSYLPYSASASSSGFPSSSTQAIDTGIPIPLDGLLTPSMPTSPERARKRNIDHDERDGRPPAKGQRLNNDTQFSRYGRNEGRSSWGGRGDRGGRTGVNGRGDYMDVAMGGTDMVMGGMNGVMGPMNGRGQSYRPPERRGICRDYHNSGYCARGAFCKYSHGDDAVIPSQLFPMNGPIQGGAMPFMPMLGNGGMAFGVAPSSNAAYDPHERMDMRPVPGSGIGAGGRAPRPPVIPRRHEANGHVPQKPGELPVIQDLTPQVPIEDVSPHNNGEGFKGPPKGTDENMGIPDMMDDMNAAPVMFPDVEMGVPQRPLPPHMRGGPRGRGGPASRGTFGGDVQSFRPERRNDKTLVVEKIPEDKLSLGAVNDWFKQFGTVTNVAVDAVNAKALVSFSSHEEAHAAWNSKEAVFGNRFVKIFWHRPMEGHGQVGARMLAASAPLVANMAKEPTPSAEAPPPAPQVPSTPVHARKASTSSAAAALAARHRLLEQQIAEQKSLMALLSMISRREEGYHAKKPRGITPRLEDHERLERERLDRELELHHAVAEGDAEENTDDLKARLDKLKAEAAVLGLPEAESPYTNSSYRPYRGRGRGGRGFFRGAMRGGAVPRSMKLDNRPKKLLIKGAGRDAVQAVRDWYETTGQVESLDATDSGDIIVSFRSRNAAELGLAKGTSISAVGPVQISWYTQPVGAVQKTSSPVHEEPDHSADRVHDPQHSLLEDQHTQEEMAGGWGGDDDDGFGML
ncbi:hypothetical protein A0H81_00580 [Grifola frondosa]|uniref:RNA-binding protein 27 n=1 Tax=Grifola frondosa TaxID=5627 RepID=A0A1C7MWR4_GRIFR|nr:hypothetical protein A0H81_00580 [Grifola frondosa]